jgi:hypothetical protein
VIAPNIRRSAGQLFETEKKTPIPGDLFASLGFPVLFAYLFAVNSGTAAWGFYVGNTYGIEAFCHHI